MIECVPNISEGRDNGVIDSIVSAVEDTPGAHLLDVYRGFDTNRSVITFAGGAKSVADAAFLCVKKSLELIDMSVHCGKHPRQGCVDVLPFIPLEGSNIEECVKISKEVGNRIGNELGLPVYLYGYSASDPKRRDLAYIRKGQYESLKDKMQIMRPDFGPCEFNATVRKGGSIQVGARNFLIAYNVNIDTPDKEIANQIAYCVRESGCHQVPGRLKGVKAIGWYIDEYKTAQISMNITDYRLTPVHVVYNACAEEAEKLGAKVTGSEIVGLIPKEALLQAGKSVCADCAADEPEIINTAVDFLGLGKLSPFNINTKVIEYNLRLRGIR